MIPVNYRGQPAIAAFKPQCLVLIEDSKRQKLHVSAISCVDEATFEINGSQRVSTDYAYQFAEEAQLSTDAVLSVSVRPISCEFNGAACELALHSRYMDVGRRVYLEQMSEVTQVLDLQLSFEYAGRKNRILFESPQKCQWLHAYLLGQRKADPRPRCGSVACYNQQIRQAKENYLLTTEQQQLASAIVSPHRLNSPTCLAQRELAELSDDSHCSVQAEQLEQSQSVGSTTAEADALIDGAKNAIFEDLGDSERAMDAIDRLERLRTRQIGPNALQEEIIKILSKELTSDYSYSYSYSYSREDSCTSSIDSPGGLVERPEVVKPTNNKIQSHVIIHE